MNIDKPIIYHEAGHALVGHEVGMRLVFADMTGLAVGCPVVGLDCDPVPAPDRPRARALAALAGPIAEARANGGKYNWRQDGEVAKVAAKALHNDDVERCSVQLIDWMAEASAMLVTHENRLKRIYLALVARQHVTGVELTRLVGRLNSQVA